MITSEIYNDIFSTHRPVIIQPDGAVNYLQAKDTDVLKVVPGSFNPLHDGHLFLYNQCQGFFEISLFRYDKEQYHLDELNNILSQFTWKYPVIITRSATFFSKTLSFKSMGFKEIHYYIGTDVIQKLIKMDPDTFLDKSNHWHIYQRLGHEINATVYPGCSVNGHLSSTKIRNSDV